MSFRTIFGDDECGGGYGLYGCGVFSSAKTHTTAKKLAHESSQAAWTLWLALFWVYKLSGSNLFVEDVMGWTWSWNGIEYYCVPNIAQDR